MTINDNHTTLYTTLSFERGKGIFVQKGQNEKKIIMERKLKLNKKIKKINNNNNHRQKQKWPKIQI